MLAPPIQQSGWRVHGDIRAQTFLEMSALVWTSPSTQLFVRRSGTGPESIPTISISRSEDNRRPSCHPVRPRTRRGQLRCGETLQLDAGAQESYCSIGSEADL